MISTFPSYIGQPADVFAAVANHNGALAKAAWRQSHTPHRSSGLVTPAVKEARRAANKRAKQARKKGRK